MTSLRYRSSLPQRSLLFLVALLLAAASATAAARSGQTLTATLLDGSRYSIAEHRGKVIVVNFWASWCAPCREEMPAIETFYRRHHARGLEVIAVSIDEAKDEAKVHDIARAYSFPVAMAAQTRHKGFGRIWRLPMTFVIDRDGKLHQDLTDKTAQVDLAFLEARVAPLLGP